tara:strand:- start:207 stop:617 length:411 start_codon:yes stop_codon:yes gene_type:complete
MTAEVPAGFAPEQGGNAFTVLIGPLYERRDGEDYAMGLRADERHANRRGVVHGGTLFTLADHTLGNMVWTANENKPCATVSLNVDFVSGARAGQWLECTGHISRETRTLIFIKGEVTADGETVMTATGIWKKLGAK